VVQTTLPPVFDALSGTTVRPQTQVAYDAAGRQTASTDADGHRTQFGYDAEGRLTTTLSPDGTSTGLQ
jgi:YD repeat-containing protein